MYKPSSRQRPIVIVRQTYLLRKPVLPRRTGLVRQFAGAARKFPRNLATDDGLVTRAPPTMVLYQH